MSATLLGIAAALIYAGIGILVGAQIAANNRGVLIRHRLSPWLRGSLWLPFCMVGAVFILCDYLLAGGAPKRRR